MKKLCLSALALWCALLPLPARAGDSLLVAVASNFVAPMREIAAAFEAETGHSVILSTGSSGKLYAQILHGAPFDVFLSADDEKPKALAHGNHALPGSRFTYALGRLALWSPRHDEPLALLQGDFQRLALANPRLAPYGQAARATLRKLGLWELTKQRQVQGENIAQTFQFVASGNADLGLVAVSQLRERPVGGGVWAVPAEFHDPIRQDAIAVVKSNKSRALMDYLKSDSARRIITRYGYNLPSP